MRKTVSRASPSERIPISGIEFDGLHRNDLVVADIQIKYQPNSLRARQNGRGRRSKSDAITAIWRHAVLAL
jgi:hypothetical protein